MVEHNKPKAERKEIIKKRILFFDQFSALFSPGANFQIFDNKGYALNVFLHTIDRASFPCVENFGAVDIIKDEVNQC